MLLHDRHRLGKIARQLNELPRQAPSLRLLLNGLVLTSHRAVELAGLIGSNQK